MFFFFFNDTATTEIYTLSLHDALPISPRRWCESGPWPGYDAARAVDRGRRPRRTPCMTLLLVCLLSAAFMARSEEHTSELQSRQYLVCRLLLEKKKYFLITFPLHFRRL